MLVTVAAPLGPARTSEALIPKAFVPVIVKFVALKSVAPSPVTVTNNPTPASAKLDAVPAKVKSPAPPGVCAAAIESSSADVVIVTYVLLLGLTILVPIIFISLVCVGRSPH